jgi:methylenetetrahydrofolate reductase (NADPH)
MMLRDIYARDGLAFSVEFFPPRTDEAVERLFAEVELLGRLDPAFASVTYGAGGSTQKRTVEIAKRIRREARIEIMCHLTIVNQPKSQVLAVLDDMRANGVHNFIALAGDPPGGPASEWQPHPEGYLHSRELVEDTQRLYPDWFSIAVAGFPEMHPRASSRELDLAYLKQKVDAGADVVITQLFFDNEDFFRFVEEARALGITVPIVPGMLPIRSAAQCRRFTALCGARIPPRLDALLDKVQDDDEAALELGIEYCTEQCQGLLEFGVPGFHFYSLNRARSVTAVYENLGLGALTSPRAELQA